jgi:hypothetical protein
MDAISLLNPFSEHHALENFNKLTLAQKVATVALTILASLATILVGTAAVFRLMVNHYVKLMHPKNENEGVPPPNRPTAIDIETDPSSALLSDIITPSTTFLTPTDNAFSGDVPNLFFNPQAPNPLPPPAIDSLASLTTMESSNPQTPNPLSPPSTDALTSFPSLLTTTDDSNILNNPLLASSFPPTPTTSAISTTISPLIPNPTLQPSPTLFTPINTDLSLPIASPAGLEMPSENLTTTPSPSDGLEEISPIIIPPSPTNLDTLLSPKLDTLDPLNLGAKKSHEIAHCNIGQTGMLLKLFGNGKIQGSIHSATCYDVDQTFKIKLDHVNIPIQVTGKCFKAEITGLNDQFAYIIKAVIQNGEESRSLDLAFLSKKDASDAVAIGNLALQHMEKKNKLGLKNKEEGFLTLNATEEATPAFFKETIQLPSSLVEEILLPSVSIPTLTPHPTIEYKGNLVERETKDDLKEILKELKKDNTVYTEAQINLEESIKAEQSAIDKTNQDENEMMKSWTDLTSSIIDKNKEREELGLKENECNLVPYIFQYINDLIGDGDNLAKSIKDSDTIAFKGGTIVKAANDGEAKKSYNAFHHILKETYGTILAERIFGRYRLNKKDTISLRDLKKAMVGIALNVLDGDLRKLFDNIKTDPAGKLTSYRAGNILFGTNKELYLKIQQKNSFDELDREEVVFLHSAFRTLPIQNTRLSVPDVLDFLKNDSEGEDFLYLHDLKALQLMESWKSLDVQFPLWALGEFTGKSLAYLELKKGLILPLPEVKEGSPLSDIPHLYKVESSLEDKNDAVVCHLLTPLNNAVSLLPNENNSHEHIFLPFRGTLPEPKAKAGGTSLYRDFKWDGIGRSSYDSREKEIQKMVEDYLAETTKENVTLHISGHSLGGCDTQRALVSMLEKVAVTEEGSPWKKLKKVVVTTFNAPRVNPTVNKRLKDAVRSIKDKSIPLEVNLDHIRFFDKSYEDTIQKFGDILLGSDLQGGTGDQVLKSCPWFKRRIIEMHMDDDQGLAAGFIIRHGYRPFNKAICNIPYKMKILNSDIEEERKAMEKMMAGNFHWDKSEMGIASQLINNFLWYSSWALFREPKKIVQAALNTVHGVGISLNQVWNSKDNAELDELRQYY